MLQRHDYITSIMLLNIPKAASCKAQPAVREVRQALLLRLYLPYLRMG